MSAFIMEHYDMLVTVVNTVCTIASSLYDIGTDSFSAYNYLSGDNIKNITSSTSITTNDVPHFYTTTPISSSNNITTLLPQTVSIDQVPSAGKTEEENKVAHIKWGSIMIVILFLPGIFWAFKPSMKQGKMGYIKRILGLFFPFFCIGYGFYALFVPKNVNVQKRLALICACEALFESFPQIVFLSYTFTFSSTSISLTSKLQAIGSVVLLAKGIISFDMVSGDVNISTLKGWIMYILKLLPLYALGTFFRIAALTFELIYLRQYAVIPTFALLVMMAICVGVCIKWDKHIIYNMALTNMSVANVGSVRIHHLLDDGIADEDEWNELPKDISKRCQRFITASCYVTFLHHTVVLMITLYLVVKGNVLADVTELEFFFQPDRYLGNTHVRMVYVTFAATIMIGTLDVLTSSCCSKNISFGQETTLDMDKSTRKEIKEEKRKTKNAEFARMSSRQVGGKSNRSKSLAETKNSSLMSESSIFESLSKRSSSVV